MWMVLHGYSDAFSVEDIQYNRIKLVSFLCWVATIYRFFCECTRYIMNYLLGYVDTSLSAAAAICCCCAAHKNLKHLSLLFFCRDALPMPTSSKSYRTVPFWQTDHHLLLHANKQHCTFTLNIQFQHLAALLARHQWKFR